jgi:hypothetical protein
MHRRTFTTEFMCGKRGEKFNCFALKFKTKHYKRIHHEESAISLQARKYLLTMQSCLFRCRVTRWFSYRSFSSSSITEIYNLISPQSYEDATNSEIWMAKRDPVTETWSSPSIAVSGHGICYMNPSIYLTNDNILRLTFHIGGEPNVCLQIY